MKVALVFVAGVLTLFLALHGWGAHKTKKFCEQATPGRQVRELVKVADDLGVKFRGEGIEKAAGYGLAHWNGIRSFCSVYVEQGKVASTDYTWMAD